VGCPAVKPIFWNPGEHPQLALRPGCRLGKDAQDQFTKVHLRG